MAIIMMVLRGLAAYYIYIDSRQRGHNAVIALLWAVAGSTIVGVPLYFLFGRKGNVEQHREDDGIIDIEASVVEQTVICSNCGKDIEEELIVCPHCNENVKPV
jgi:hypothetical protein